MSNEFKCPSCAAPMEFSGGDSIFQTCKKCNAPIVVPSEILYTKEQQIDAEDFATLANDKSVADKQVSLDVGAGEVANDDGIEEIISNRQGDEFASQTSEMDFTSENVGAATSQRVQSAERKTPSEAQINQLNYLINQGRKDEAARFYRGIYDCEINVAQVKVEKLFEQSKSNRNTAISNDSNQIILTQIEKELAGGNKINAIKVFMNAFDTGLAESKEVVDAMQSGRKVDISGFRRR